MKWISIKEQLPIDKNEFGGTIYLVTVVSHTWNKTKTMVMEWE